MYDMSSVYGKSLPGHHHFHQLPPPSNHFYAFYLGPALVISFSTEFYYFVQYGFAPILAQYRWLEAVLEAANRPEARAAHPWIITFGKIWFFKTITLNSFLVVQFMPIS